MQSAVFLYSPVLMVQKG